MNIYDQLYKTFAEQNGMLEREILALGYTKQDIEDTLEENKFEEVEYNPQEIGINIGKVYTFVTYNIIFNNYGRSSVNQDIILRYLLGEKLEYGYFTGFSAVIGIGASDQYLNEVTVCSVLAKNIINIFNITVNPIEQMKYESGYYNMFKESLDYCLTAFDKSPKKPILRGIENGIIEADKLYKILETDKAKDIILSLMEEK